MGVRGVYVCIIIQISPQIHALCISMYSFLTATIFITGKKIC